MIKITIECSIEDLLSIIARDSFVSVTSKEEGVDRENDSEVKTRGASSDGDGDKEEDLPNRPGAGVGVTGPGRPSGDESGKN